jgi:hypothetical protein
MTLAVSTLLATFIFAQHPDRKKIDSLKNLLPSTTGIRKIDCLNALSEEYWWPPRVWPDSTSSINRRAIMKMLWIITAYC